MPTCPRCGLTNYYYADPSNGCLYFYECVRCNIRYIWLGGQLVQAGAAAPAIPPTDGRAARVDGVLWRRTAGVQTP
jgi:hypothetical protein